MTVRKPQNSILVLATLGVYFGLVLVGATPQVLAQAAMTRQFNVKDEVEVKDDLDKKPDSEEIKAFLDKNLETALSAFVEDLRKLKAQGKYRAVGGDRFAVNSSRQFCAEKITADSGFDPSAANDSAAWIGDAFASLQRNLNVSNYWRFADVPAFIQSPTAVGEDDHCKKFALTAEVNSSDFVVRVSFSRESPKSAAALAGNLNQIFSDRAANHKIALQKQIYELTKASSEKSQVLIVTRLPRAGLDSLLAKSAK